MSKTATIAIPSSNGLFGRLLASIDRLLMMSAKSQSATATSPASVCNSREPRVPGVDRPVSARARSKTFDQWPRFSGPFFVH